MGIRIVLLASALAGSVAFAPAAFSSSAEQAQDQGTGSDDFTSVENEAGSVGAHPRPGQTERVSLASDGTEGNSNSFQSRISADGRHVAFQSGADNLVPGDTNGDTGGPLAGFDIFVHDRETGATRRVSVASDGTEGNDYSLDPSISGDGRYVAFWSVASNLVPGDTNLDFDVFVHDLETQETRRVSVAADGSQVEGTSWQPSISADGRHVAFHSAASKLVPDDANGETDVFVHDLETGEVELVSVASDGSQGQGFSGFPSISAGGQHVAFESFAFNLAPAGKDGDRDIYVHDRSSSVTERVSISTDGSVGDHQSRYPAISAEGQYVAFESFASNLVPHDTNGLLDIFVHDRVTEETERVSVASDGSERQAYAMRADISADGRFVGFHSEPVPPHSALDSNGKVDVLAYVHDRVSGETEVVSVTQDGGEPTDGAGSYRPRLSPTGRFVTFGGGASGFVPGDTNGADDVFVRDRGPTLGPGSWEAEVLAGGSVRASGWATFSGEVLASASDSADDGAEHAEELGAELIGTSLVFRPEAEDLLVRFQLASLPGTAIRACAVLCVGTSTGAGVPGILYGVRLDLEGTRYEIRGLRAGATAVPPATPSFALYECEPDCTEVARLSGGIGTTGPEARVSVPLDALGVEAGAALTGIEVFTALGEATPGALEILDEMDLPAVSVPVPRLELGVAPPSAPEADVTFSAQADLAEGRFSGTLDVSPLPAGEYRAWARACLGEVCGASSVALTR